MFPQKPRWLERNWKWLVALLLLLTVGGISIGVFAWRRGADTVTPSNAVGDNQSDNEPKRMLSQYTNIVNALVFSPDGRQLATAGFDKYRQGEIRLWDMGSGREIRGCQDASATTLSLAFSPDGQFLADGEKIVSAANPGSGSQFQDTGGVKLWNLTTDAKPSLWQNANKAVLSVAFSPLGDKLAVACEDGSLTLYNCANGQVEQSLRADSGVNLSSNVAFSADGMKIAWGGVRSSGSPNKRAFQGVLYVWDTVSGKLVTTLHPPENRKGVPAIKSLAFLPDAPKIVAACEQKIYFWDLQTGQIEAILPGHPNRIEGIALSRDGRLLASLDNDGGIKLWQVSPPREQATLQNFMRSRSSPKQEMGLALAFAPDGRSLVSSTIRLSGTEAQGGIKLWDVATAKEIALPR